MSIGGEPRKKTAESIQSEVAQELEQLLRVILADLRKAGKLDLEAVEMATRATMHRAGTAVLKELLQKTQEQVVQEVACGCGRRARFHEMRPKQILTVVGASIFNGPITFAITATKAKVHSTLNWIYKVRNVHPAFGA